MVKINVSNIKKTCLSNLENNRENVRKYSYN